MEKRDDTLRLGIIGCGNAAERWHLPALRQLADVRLVAAADIDPARVRRVGEKFDIEQQFTDYRAMIDRADIQAIAIITPTQSHAEPALDAIAAGKSVLIDKPLAMTLAECDRLIAAAESSPGKVMVGFNLRWHRLVQRARAIIESGALGEIKAVTGVYSHWHPGEKAQVWHKRRETGGGILFNEGVHHFDLWRSLLGTEVADIYAVSRPSEHFEDETSTIVARMTDGISASCTLVYESSPNNEIQILGRQGRLHLSLYRFDGLEFFPNSVYPGDVRERLRRIVAAAGKLPETLPVMFKGGDSALSYLAQWRHFADCVLHDRQPDCSLLDGRRAVEIALAAIESVSTNRPVAMTTGEEAS